MSRAATLPALLALALLPLAMAAEAAVADSAKAAVKPLNAAVQQAVKAAPEAVPGAVKPAADTAKTAVPAAPATATPAPTAPTPAPAGAVVPPPPPKPDSVTARRYRVANRPFSRDEAKYFQTVLNFRVKGKPESTAVNWLFRDDRGALLTYEKGKSEWAYSYDTVAFLDPKEYVADSLIRFKTDGLLKNFLRERAAGYAFVNYEKTMVQARDTGRKEGAAPAVPAYYIGRYLRKLDGRYVLGENFQVRIGVGRANAPVFISYREPLLKESSIKERLPSKEMIEEYLAKWAKDKKRLGTRYYPYNPDRLRIKALKPVKVFESYVLADEKFRTDPAADGTYLVPRVTVLAEAVLAPSTKRLKTPHPNGPVLLHFHFPCTPSAGLCWPDGKQGMEEGMQADIGTQPPLPPPTGTQPPSLPKPEIPPKTN